MKPLVLKLTAFGPYKNTETIDFNELKGNNLYVISGNTGAGKTTIFDGICFALYGSASGTDREDMRMLRSHFADDDIHTAVELTFSLNKRSYRILRQMGHIKAGNKTRTGERYEFYEITDSGEVPCVERQIVSEIDRKIESLIGLNQDQFKQIVMLPQGEFRKLLTSSTENKEEILRRLFKTDRYQQLNDILKKRLDQAHEQLVKFSQQKEHYIQQIRGALPEREESPLFMTLNTEHHNVHQIIDGLRTELDFYNEKIILDKNVLHKAQTEFEQKQKTYIHAQHMNKRFEERDLKEIQLQEHLSKSEEIEQLKTTVQLAEKASQIEPYELQVKQITSDLHQKTEQYEQAKNALSRVSSELEKASQIYQTEEANSEKRQKTYLLLERLHEQLPVVNQLQTEKKNVTALKEVYEKLDHQLKSESNILLEKQNYLKKLKEQITAEAKVPEEYLEKSQALSSMRDKAKVLKDYIKVAQNESTLKSEFNAAQTHYSEIKSRYDQMEEAWLNNQASELATHLHDGESCPVCGSLEHPNKAINTKDTVTRAQLDNFRKELNQSDRTFQAARTNLDTNTKQIEEKIENFKEYGLTKEDALDYEAFVETGKKLKDEVESLKERKSILLDLNRTQEQEQKIYDNLDSNVRKLTESVSNAELEFKQTEYVYLEKIKSIPEDLQNPDSFNKKIHDTQTYYEKLEAAWKEAQETYHQLQNQHIKEKTNEDHLKNNVAELEKKQHEAQEAFQTKLARAAFKNEIHYTESKISATKLEELKEEIDSFIQKRQTLTEQLKSLNEELSSQQRQDLTAMKTAVEELKATSEQALHILNESKRYAEDITKLIEQIIEVSKNEVDSEKHRASIQGLYDTIRGQNKHKLSFERYLQIEYLEQIIDACNHRLRTLSNGQFQLIHSERQETRGKQSGLALDVQDSLTGETRDVKTMSGGEKFNASLCLALGMSDVIQSFQGNISIDTLFIDEGFGSLDEESLDNATRILIDLQQTGRTIGVISHVQELKRILPATLEVRKTKDGYSTTHFSINN